MTPAVTVGLRKALYALRGVVLLDAALLAEQGLLPLCNGHVILRRGPRGRPDGAPRRPGPRRRRRARRRVEAQWSTEEKRARDRAGNRAAPGSGGSGPGTAPRRRATSGPPGPPPAGPLRHRRAPGAGSPCRVTSSSSAGAPSCARVGVDPARAAPHLDALVAAYGEPHRAYHGLAHVAHVFAELDGVPLSDPAVEWATWYHDAVYRPGRRDNEARSAALARGALEALGLAPPRTARRRAHRWPPACTRRTPPTSRPSRSSTRTSPSSARSLGRIFATPRGVRQEHPLHPALPVRARARGVPPGAARQALNLPHAPFRGALRAAGPGRTSRPSWRASSAADWRRPPYFPSFALISRHRSPSTFSRPFSESFTICSPLSASGRYSSGT